MGGIRSGLTRAEAEQLTQYLASPERPDGTLGFHELQGFLFVVASSPETIPPSEWLSAIGGEQELDFADEEQARQILNCIMALYNEINTAVLERSEKLPAGCTFSDDVLANFEEGAAISEWSRGFWIGYDWLSEVWESSLPKEMDEEFGATLLVLSFFCSRELAEAYFEDQNPNPGRHGGTFEQFASSVRQVFPSALASHAHMGRTIFEVSAEMDFD